MLLDWNMRRGLDVALLRFKDTRIQDVSDVRFLFVFRACEGLYGYLMIQLCFFNFNTELAYCLLGQCVVFSAGSGVFRVLRLSRLSPEDLSFWYLDL